MGTSSSWIAIRGTEDDTLRVLLESGWELVRSQNVACLGEAGELYAPLRAEARAQDGAAWSLMFCWRDGEYTVLQDLEMSLPTDDARLAALSERVGDTLALTLATHGGCAGFSFFSGGVRKRHVWNDNSEVEMDGMPLAEEDGIDIGQFYMDETEELWAAFGLTDYFVGGEPVKVLVLNDPVLAARFAALPRPKPPPKKPWWKRLF